MNEIYVLNKDLERVTMIEMYNSLIWAKRYNAVGDCEVYVPATTENLQAFQKGFYISRPDDDMVCQINYLEIDTDGENGNYLIVKGVDVKDFLDRRIVWDKMTISGGNGEGANAEILMRQIVDNALGTTALEKRQITNTNGNLIFGLGELNGFEDTVSGDIEYLNIGELLREWCKSFSWGYLVFIENQIFKFKIFKGNDVSDSVIFSNKYENLKAIKRTYDGTSIKNASKIIGARQPDTGLIRGNHIVTIGDENKSDKRFESFCDATGTSATMKFGDVKLTFGEANVEVTQHLVWAHEFYAQIYSEKQLQTWEALYGGGSLVTKGQSVFWRAQNVRIGMIDVDSPSSDTDVVLSDIVYQVLLYGQGASSLSGLTEKTTLEGEIEALSTTFKYKQDYDLGDIVMIAGDFGIQTKARITEVVEVNDDNGYSLECKFSYLTEE